LEKLASYCKFGKSMSLAMTSMMLSVLPWSLNARGQSQVLLSPNILVSPDSSPQTEPIIAADPIDERKLVGASVVSGRTNAGFACRVYSSDDGGYTWTSSSVPEQEKIGGADPQTAFGIHGTAYFAAIAAGPLDEPSGIYFYRSEDGGRTWGKGLNLGGGDHEEIVVDSSVGKYAGRVYVAMERTVNQQLGIYVFRSDDDGRSFVGPVLAAHREGLGVNATNLQLFSDGSLFVPFVTFATDPQKSSNTRGLEFVVSGDGGVTFSGPQHILDYHHPQHEQLYQEYKNGSVVQYTFPQFAVGHRGGSFRDRLYMAWSDVEHGKARVLFAFSTDRGQHWTAPREMTASPTPDSAAFQQAIAVNKDGVVGLMWFESQDRHQASSFDVYFSVSRDGGASFSQPVKISSATSFPLHNANLAPFAMSEKNKGSLSLYFLSPMNRWNGGGDYVGLVADAKGVFHPFWPDARAGVYQIYTARIDVNDSDSADPQQGKPTATNLTSDIALVFDPVVYDSVSRDLELPVRIKNISQRTLYGPIRVELRSLTRAELSAAEREDVGNVPEILNAANGKRGPGAAFDYSRALGTVEALPPGSVSEAVRWKLRMSRPFFTSFYIDAIVSGFLAQR
jgi:hypothetical protein